MKRRGIDEVKMIEEGMGRGGNKLRRMVTMRGKRVEERGRTWERNSSYTG
jgi:hypothetical protein